MTQETKTEAENTKKKKGGPSPIDQQIARTEAKLARQKEQARKQDASGKIILGAALLAAAKDDKDTLRDVIALIEKRVTRASDKSRIAPLLRVLKIDLGEGEQEQTDEQIDAKAE